MTISHVFFGLHGVLIDPVRLRTAYPIQLAQVMAAHFGGSPEHWQAAYAQVVNTWDDYAADLNFSEDYRDVYELGFRTTRALLRLAGQPEPAHEELWRFACQLPGLVMARIDTLYGDVASVVRQLSTAGYVLAVCSYLPSDQMRALLKPLLNYLGNAVIGPDAAGRFDLDADFYAAAAALVQVEAGNCLVVDSREAHIAGARAAGMRAARICRDSRLARADALRELASLQDSLIAV